jgi:nicotinamidase-related amidase
MKVNLFIIDPQIDFCDSGTIIRDGQGNPVRTADGNEVKTPAGALCVAGADADCERLSKMILRLINKIDDINVTLDSHRTVDVAHPIFWVNSKGEHPTPFTIISEDDVVNGVWMATNPAWRKKATDYVKSLYSNKRYPLCIWPPHCRIGSRGHGIMPNVSDALLKWEEQRFACVNFVTKGSNVFTEHYSAVKADVPDPADPSTQLNTELLDILSQADLIPIAGQALSHCVANTITDVADNFGEDNIKKFVLLEDCCSNVGGFEQLGKDFVDRMVKRGMRVAKSTTFLA